MAGNCGSTCPVDEGFYSYQPSISGNTAFIVIFGLLFAATLFLGWRFRNLHYSALLSASQLLQILAFVGRVLLHRARDSQPYFLIFLLGTLLAPLFAAGTIISAWSSLLAVGTTQPPFLGRRAVLHVGMLALLLSVLGLELAGAVLLCYGQTVQLVSVASLPIYIVTNLKANKLHLCSHRRTCRSDIQHCTDVWPLCRGIVSRQQRCPRPSSFNSW